jgi:hypothetical protein
MDEIDRPRSESFPLPQKVSWSAIVFRVNYVLLVWPPSLAAIGCTVAGFHRGQPLIFVMALLFAIAAFLGWCFAQGME